MMPVPLPDPRVGRGRRIAGRVVLVICGLIIIANVALWVATHTSSEKIDANRTHALRLGSVVLLADPSTRDVHCTVTGGGVPEMMLVPASSGFPVMGRLAGEVDAGPFLVTCDGQVTVASGPVVFLYPLTSLFWFAVLISLVIGWFRWRRTRSFATVNRLWQMARISLSRRRDRLR